MKISAADSPWTEVSHNPAIRKQVFVAHGEVPHVTQFARSIFQPGEVAPAHSHPDMWEVFLVTSGILTIEVDGVAHELKAGASITLAPHEEHELRNAHSEDLHLTYFGIVGSQLE
jgi:quercetin dioxygenase-like cupin family protein